MVENGEPGEGPKETEQLQKRKLLFSIKNFSMKPGKDGTSVTATVEIKFQEGILEFLNTKLPLAGEWRHGKPSEVAAFMDTGDPDQEKLPGMESPEEREHRMARRGGRGRGAAH